MNMNGVVEGLIANLSRFAIFVPMTVYTTTTIISNKKRSYLLYFPMKCACPHLDVAMCFGCFADVHVLCSCCRCIFCQAHLIIFDSNFSKPIALFKTRSSHLRLAEIFVVLRTCYRNIGKL